MTVNISSFPFSFDCDGVTHEFHFLSKIMAEGDLVITLRNNVTGVDTILTIGTQYEVTGENNKFDTGGYVHTIEYVDAVKTDKDYSSDYTIIIDRVTAIIQSTEYKTGRRLTLENHGNSFDRLTIIAQELYYLILRSIVAPVDDEGTSNELPSKAARANKYLFFDSDGNPTAVADLILSGTAVSAFMVNVVAAANVAAARILLGLVYATSAEAKAGVLSDVVLNPADLAAVIQSGCMNYAVASGTDTYTATLVPSIAEYPEGSIYHIKFTNANLTTNPTLALNSLAAKTIVREGDLALAIGDIPAGSRQALLYSGGYLVLLSPYKARAFDVLITAAMLASNAVTEAKILNGAVTVNKIGAGAVTEVKIGAGAISIGKLAAYVAGTTVTLASAPTERNTTNATYTKKKEIEIKRGGIVTVTFSIRHAWSHLTAYGKIYVNDVDVGTERQRTADTYETFVENITVVAGDLLQVFIKSSEAGQPAYVKDVLVQCIDPLEAGATVITD